MQIAVIGGGAAGFFAAISAQTHHPDAQVYLFEKSSKLLSKVKVSGGGRCNVTNGTESIKELSAGYPRGGKKLKNLFAKFGTKETRAWFESRGVELYTQEDGRVFPVTDNSQTIIDCLLGEAEKLGVQINLSSPVKGIEKVENGIRIQFEKSEVIFDKVIVATGGSPKRSGLDWLEAMGHEIEDPVPSLFTFNMPKNPVTNYMGLSVKNAIVRVEGTKLVSEGPLLVTHWGMSGPAVLKLSSIGARELANLQYNFQAAVNWSGVTNRDWTMEELNRLVSEHPKKQIRNTKVFDIPERLWFFLLEKAELDVNSTWMDLKKKQLQKLAEILTNDIYPVKGKTTFKEEFVTCGGVSLSSVDMKTMESKAVSGLYFCGEVLDIDGITGGYNFQAAWTTGHFAGQLG